jgi:hypothetical protein
LKVVEVLIDRIETTALGKAARGIIAVLFITAPGFYKTGRRKDS